MAQIPDDPALLPLLRSIAEALERLAPPAPASAAFDGADAFIWHAEGEWLEAVSTVNRVDLELLRGIDRSRDILLDNTRRFAKGLPANNALLWGARGTGQSSLVKAAHATVNQEQGPTPAERLALVEIHRGALVSLPALLRRLRGETRRFLRFFNAPSFPPSAT